MPRLRATSPPFRFVSFGSIATYTAHAKIYRCPLRPRKRQSVVKTRSAALGQSLPKDCGHSPRAIAAGGVAIRRAACLVEHLEIDVSVCAEMPEDLTELAPGDQQAVRLGIAELVFGACATARLSSATNDRSTLVERAAERALPPITFHYQSQSALRRRRQNGLQLTAIRPCRSRCWLGQWSKSMVGTFAAALTHVCFLRGKETSQTRAAASAS